MKAATFGLVLGALSVANAQMFDDEDTFLQEEWEDLEGDRELQLLDEEIPVETEAEFVEPESEPEGEGEVEEEEGGERKRNRRNNRRRRREYGRKRRNRRGNKGRKGKRGRKGRKGEKKGPFNIEEYNKKMVEKTKNMQRKLKMKCQKRAKFANKFCE